MSDPDLGIFSLQMLSSILIALASLGAWSYLSNRSVRSYVVMRNNQKDSGVKIQTRNILLAFFLRCFLCPIALSLVFIGVFLGGLKLVFSYE